MRGCAAAGIARDDYFAGILDTNVMPTPSGDRLFGLPWYVDTRLLFYRSDLLRARRPSAAAAELGRVAARDARVRSSAAARSGALLPLNEPDPLLALALQQGAAAARRRHARRLLAAPFRRALDFYAASSARAWRRR